MPFSVTAVEDGPWIAVDFYGKLDPTDMVDARWAGAELNPGGLYKQVLIDFLKVSAFIFTPETGEAIKAANRQRSALLDGSRCALVYTRGVIGLIARLVAYTSGLNAEFRQFATRAEAESWLRGDAPDAGKPLRSRGSLRV